MLLSILICTRNRCSALRQTLDAFHGVRTPEGTTAELLVIDNGSEDATREIVTSFLLPGVHVAYIREPSKGKAAALNTGLAHARGEILILTDDDIRPSPDWLCEISSPIASGRYDAVSGRVTLARHLFRPWMKHVHTGWLAATDYLNPIAPESAVGANMAFCRRVLERVPAFDPELGPGRLGLWEDTLFSMQLLKTGFRLGMAEGARVEHHFESERLSRAAFLSRARAEARSSAYVSWHWKHESRPGSMLRVAHLYQHLLAKRATRWADWHQSEGMPEWEINLITGIEFERHHQKERRRCRTYAKFGTRKL